MYRHVHMLTNTPTDARCLETHARQKMGRHPQVIVNTIVHILYQYRIPEAALEHFGAVENAEYRPFSARISVRGITRNTGLPLVPCCELTSFPSITHLFLRHKLSVTMRICSHATRAVGSTPLLFLLPLATAVLSFMIVVLVGSVVMFAATPSPEAFAATFANLARNVTQCNVIPRDVTPHP